MVDDAGSDGVAEHVDGRSESGTFDREILILSNQPVPEITRKTRKAKV